MHGHGGHLGHMIHTRFISLQLEAHKQNLAKIAKYNDFIRTQTPTHSFNLN